MLAESIPSTLWIRDTAFEFNPPVGPLPKFNVVVDHKLEREHAVAKLRGFSESIREQSPVELSDVEESWDQEGNLQFAFKALGLAISGTLQTDDDQIVVTGNMPLAAAMFRGAHRDSDRGSNTIRHQLIRLTNVAKQPVRYSTVTLLARFRGLSTSHPRRTAM